MSKTKTSQITQSELEMCFAIHRAANTLAFLLGKKLDQGATVEPGHYTIQGGLPGDLKVEELSAIHILGITIAPDVPPPEIFGAEPA
jgi:hypothetical protein